MTWVLALILMIVSTGASAQTLRVRSGEHDGYTRLVIQIPPDTGWDLIQHEGGARLNIAIDGVSFDTSAVFDRLNGVRLQSLNQSASGTGLDMEFGCECTATAFLYRQTMVVVDIAPGRFTSVVDSALAAMPGLPIESKSTVPTPPNLPATELVLPLLQLNQRNFEGQLMSRILQSADREVVDLDLASTGPRNSVRLGPLRPEDQLAPNLRLSSVLDDARGLPNLAIPDFDAQPECISDNELGLETWSGTQPFTMQVAELRTGLFQEFDKVDTDRAIKLAQLYAYHGFGAETLQVLSLLSEPTTDTIRLNSIASVMDGLATPSPNPFEGQQRCEGSVALWAVLTEGRLHPDAQLNIVEQGFSRLPSHLRQHFGPVLADILVASDQLEASRRVLRAVERVLDYSPADVILAKAKITDAAGDSDAAEALLVEVVDAPAASEEAPLALARIIEKRWSNRGTVSPRELDLAAGYAREFRKSELGPVMARAHIQALALSQDFDDAIQYVIDKPDNVDWQRTRDQTLQLLAERADDITFLRHSLRTGHEPPHIAAVETAIALAERLAALGFPAQAYAMVNRPQDRGFEAKRAQVRARIALSQNRPHQALLDIEGDQSETARTLRAKAMMQTQEFEAAAEYLDAMGQGEAAERASWLAGIVDSEAGSSNVFAELKQVTESLVRPAQRQPDKPLSDATDLLTNSADTREQIARMLSIVRGDAQN